MFAKLLNSSSRSCSRWVAHAALSLAPLVLCAGSQTAFAQAGASCVPGGTPEQTGACAVQKFQEADTQLNIYYGDVMRILSAHERPSLRQDQNAWNRTRRDYCNRQTRADEGKPNWTQLYNECMVRVIQARRNALSQWMHTGEAPPPEASLPK